MNAICIDGKSIVTILWPFGEVVRLPFDVSHNYGRLERLADQNIYLNQKSRILMEATGRYHWPVAAALHERGAYLSVLKPLAIHGYNPDGNASNVKPDQKDSMRIAKFVLDHWTDLREYTTCGSCKTTTENL